MSRAPLAVLSLALASLLGTSALAQQRQLQWIETPRFDAPSGAAVAYDTARRVAVLFRDGDTWEWDGERWILRDPANSPQIDPLAAGTITMAYDSARRRVVLFQGQANETWEWNGDDWSLASSTSGPQPGALVALTYDAARGQVLMFGMQARRLWGWDGSSWIVLANGGPPASTSYIAYDPLRQVTVLFNFRSEIWEWDGATWFSRGAPLPPFMFGGGAVYDASRAAVVFETLTAQNGYITGEWDGQSWVGGIPAIVGSGFPTLSQAMWYDGVRRKTVMVGGDYSSSGFTSPAGDDMWEWDGASWSVFEPALAYPIGGVRPMVYDSARQRVVMYGGQFSLMGDHWEWDGLRWLQPTAAATPGSRLNPVLVYDAARQSTVLFGGEDNQSIFFTDTWTWDGVAWTQLSPTTSPPGMRTHAFAFDAARERVVVLGGSQTWEWDGSDWQRVFTANSPQGLSLPRMAYDAQRGEIVLFGGPQSGTAGETWTYDGVDWEQRFPASSPQGRRHHAMAYDAERRRVVVHGGTNDSATLPPLSDTWEWDGESWTAVILPGGPDARGASMAYDAARGQMVLFGGLLDYWMFFQARDTWVYGRVVRAESEAYGEGCRRTATEMLLTGVGRPAVGVEGYRVELLQAPSGAPSVLLLATSSRVGPLVEGCVLWIDPNTHFASLPATVNDAGVARYPLQLPAGEAFPGMQLFGQALVFERGAERLTSSHGLRMVSGY